MGKEMTRRDPFGMFAPFTQVNRRWSDMLRDFYGDEGASRMVVPAMDVAESDDKLTISTELPGMKKDEVKITIEHGVLTISGEKKFEQEQTKQDYHCVERRYGAFHRQVQLPSQVDATKAKASFEDGVLTIEVPKAEEAKPRELQID